jgi:hypothetical protein
VEVVFVDTNVLLNILQVPGCGNQVDFDHDIAEFERLVNQGDQLVFPLTAVVEAGNAVASISGRDKHSCITRYLDFLQASQDGTAPWVAAGSASTAALVAQMLTNDTSTLGSLMLSGVGAGDAAILAEMALLRQRMPSGTPMRIWTRDEGLNSYNS